MTKPFRFGTGIPYGMSPFAFAGGAAEAGNTVGAGFSSLTDFGGSSSGLASVAAAFDSRDVSRPEACFFLVGPGEGWGWKAFEIDWPTFLKKSPTGSAFAQRPLNKKSATTGKQIQRELMRRLIRLSAFNVKP